MNLSEEKAKDILDFLAKKTGYEEIRIQKVTREENLFQQLIQQVLS